MQELDVANVRELEDFLINECMYAVIILSSFYLNFSPHYIELYFRMLSIWNRQNIIKK